MEKLISLVALNVRGNKIRILPDEVALLPNLERLDVTNNDLAEFVRTSKQNDRIFVLDF